MVEAGLGISVIPALAVPPAGLRQLTVLPLLPLLPRAERAVVLVHRRNRVPAPFVILRNEAVTPRQTPLRAST